MIIIESKNENIFLKIIMSRMDAAIVNVAGPMLMATSKLDANSAKTPARNGLIASKYYYDN